MSLKDILRAIGDFPLGSLGFNPEERSSLDKIIDIEGNMVIESFEAQSTNNKLNKNLRSRLLEELSQHMRSDSAYIHIDQYFTELGIEKEDSQYYTRINNLDELYVPKFLISVAERKIKNDLEWNEKAKEFVRKVIKPLADLIYVVRLVNQGFRITFGSENRYRVTIYPYDSNIYSKRSRADIKLESETIELGFRSVLENYHEYRKIYAEHSIGPGYPRGLEGIFHKPKDYLKPKKIITKT